MIVILRHLITIFLVIGVLEALEFIDSLSDTYAVLGQPLFWTCSVRRTDFQEPLYYQWQFEDASIKPAELGIVDFGNGTIFLPEVKSTNLGIYMCRVGNSRRMVESQAKLSQSFASNSVTMDAEGGTVRLRLGSNYSIHCGFDAQPAADFVWLLNGNDVREDMQNFIILKNQTHSTLKIENVKYGNIGVYQCQIQHELLTQSLRSQIIDIQVFGEPQLDHSLTSQTVPVGYNATFRCPVHGNPTPFVVWTFAPSSTQPFSTSNQTWTLRPYEDSNSSATIGSSYIFVDDNGMSLTITATENANNGMYTCEWSNMHGSVNSSAFLYLANRTEFPVITQPLENTTTFMEGSVLNLNCSGTGIPTPQIEWSLPDGDHHLQYASIVEQSISGDITATGTLVINNLQRNHSGQYECMLINAEGNATTVTFVDVTFKPYFIRYPYSVTVDVGSRAIITCDANGNPKPEITWSPPWLNDMKLSSSNSPRFSVDGNGSIVIDSVSQNHQGIYMCQAANSAGFVSANAYITVRAPPVIVQPPMSIGAVENERIELSCQVSGYPLPVIVWIFFPLPDPSVQTIDIASLMRYALFGQGNWTGEPMVDLSTSLKEGVRIEGGLLIILQAKDTDAGLYVCSAKNNHGLRKAAADVRVVTFPKFEIKPVSKKVLPGHLVILDCHSIGVPVPSQRWLFNNRRIQLSSRFKIYENGSLIIDSIQINELGTYTCLATNEFGQRSVTANLLMSLKPTFETKPRNSSFVEFQNGTLDCRGKSSMGFTTSWFKINVTNGENIFLGNISNEQTTLTSQLNIQENILNTKVKLYRNGSLYFSCVERTDESWYFCSLHNEDGMTKSEMVYVEVDSYLQEINMTLPFQSKAGDNAQIACEVRNSPSSEISWITPKMTELNTSSSSYPGVVINDTSRKGDELKSILIINAMSNENHGGDWSCRACNIAGCFSAKSTLLIEDRPVISAISAAISGRESSFQCISFGIPKPVINFYSNGSKIVDRTEGHSVVEDTLIVQRLHVKQDYMCEAVNSFGSRTILLSKPQEMTINRVIPYARKAAIEVVGEFPLVHLFPSYIVIEYNKESATGWNDFRVNITGKLASYLDIFKFIILDTNKSCSDSEHSMLEREQPPDNTKLFVTSDGHSYKYMFLMELNLLIPHTKYNIRAALGNHLGLGAVSSDVQIFTLPVAPPPVTNITVSVLHRAAQITWINPDPLNGPSEDIFVQGVVFQVHNRSITRQKTLRVTDEPILTFNKLHISEYQLKLIAINQQLNESSNAVYQTFVVVEESPRFVPEIIKLKSIASRHVSITWTVPVNVSQLVPPVTGYSVVIAPKEVQNSDIILNVTGANTSSVTLMQLKERQEYAVRIASRNTEGVSSYSLPQTFITAYAPFSTLPLGTADLSNTSWRLIAIVVVATLLPLGIFAIMVAIAMQVKLNRRGHAEITTESTDSGSFGDGLTTPAVEGVMNSNVMLY